MSTTTNYGWTKPTVGGDLDTWGAEQNGAFDGIDTTVKGIDTRVATIEARPTTYPALLASGNVTAAAVFLNLNISSYTAYKRLEIKLNYINPGASTTALALQFSTDAGSTWITTGYKWILADLSTAYAMTSDTTASDVTQIQLMNSHSVVSGTIEIVGPSGGPIVKSNLSGSERVAYHIFHGAGSNNTTGVNAVKIYFIGDVASSGTYDLIGYA